MRRARVRRIGNPAYRVAHAARLPADTRGRCGPHDMRTIMRPLVAFLALSLLSPPIAAGNVYVLAGGGRIEGVALLNADESPREKYVIKTDAARR